MASTAALAGDWLNTAVCTPIGGGRAARQAVRIERRSDTEVALLSGVRVYGRSDCAGLGVSQLSAVGTVSFTRQEGDATVAAHWGAWRTVTGTVSQVAWARTADGALCLLGDANPSVLPTLAQVAQAAAASQRAGGCYVRLPEGA